MPAPAPNPTTPPSAASAAIDAAALERLAKDVGGPEMLRELLGDYMAEAPRLLEALRAAFAKGDLAAVERAAHTLKSLSASFGALTLSAACKAIEDTARAGTPVEPAAVARAEAEFVQVRTVLERYKQG